MRHTLLLKSSGFGLLMIASALTPLATQASEGDTFDRLRTFQSEQKWTAGSERGAQGPIRTEEMTSSKLSVGEGNLYDNLKALQDDQKPMTARHGAQGPIRTTSMEAPRAYGESDMYLNVGIDAAH